MGWAGGNLNVPNFNAWIQNAWGSGGEFWSAGPAGFFSSATNLVFGQNPPYFLDDFLSIYPKFFGLPTPLANCACTSGLNTVTVPNATGLAPGQFVQAIGILAPGSVIVGINGNSVTLNNPALVTNGSFGLSVFQASPIPTAVILLYLNLAVASLQQVRWQEMWYVGIGLYIAHFLTLYAKSDETQLFETLVTAIHGEVPSGAVPGTVYTLSGAPPGGVLQSLTVNGAFQVPSVAYTLNGSTITFSSPTPGGAAIYATWPIQVAAFQASQPNGASIAAQGLAGGIQTSKGVGDVSVSYQALEAVADWAAFGLTTYGQQLVTFARVVGMGPMVIY